MNLDEELRTAFVSEAERREPPLVDAHGILARGKARQRRRRVMVQAGVAAAVVAVIGIGAFGFAQSARTATLPAAPPSTVPIAPTLLDWDCDGRGCLDPGTYRVWLGTGDDGDRLSVELRVPWRDWSSDGFSHHIRKDDDGGRVTLNVYEPSGLAGSQPCPQTVGLAPDATVDDVVGRLSGLPQFTVVDGPTTLSAFGRETVHLRIRADSLRCEPPADWYHLAEIYGGDGGDAYLNADGGDSRIALGHPVLVDLWVFDLEGQNIVVEARHEGDPTAATTRQLESVLQSLRFVSEA